MITIEQVKEKKAILQSNIAELIMNFEKNTGFEIDDIKIDKVYFEDKADAYLTNVKIKASAKL